MTTLDDNTSHLRTGLAEDLSRVLTSDVWRSAFLAVPRHLFAPRFAVYDAVHNSFDQHDVQDDDPVRRAKAMTAAYRDDTLITRFDDDGVPISSSTEPSLMAAMLEQLDIASGGRVLEIGTGTGYNAALLCVGLGDDVVTTIDVDPDLVADARTALAACGYTPDTRCGDGAVGVGDRAPFDRILATCGVDRVPSAWLTQLSEAGAILVNVSKGIVLLRRDGSGVSGRFLSQAGFMPLRSPHAADPISTSPRDVLAATEITPDSVDSMPASAVAGLPFVMASFFAALVAERSRLVSSGAEADAPDAYHWTHVASGSWARADLDAYGVTIRQAGPRRLWTELVPILDAWHAAGRPGIDRFGLTVTAGGRHTLWLDEPANVLRDLG
ncbi:hypothetical protein [Actinoalloteichus sp. GBA129-24]|uniref:hypothetical protein n=1 Tax=Actinoalloteichus sp. GBA129-24 TaxID=1612551 RepID=UPI0009504D82|nr:hypothetical protein [Actinoalloteichus sp. GBA129-24]APU22591.1 protein-L-isoaspartate carboxylmethyltransferase [Actinoalloteichus sp. GBA129-24]